MRWEGESVKWEGGECEVGGMRWEEESVKWGDELGGRSVKWEG